MTDQTRATLDRLMDDVPIGPAPIDTLLTAGRTAKHRKRMTLIGATAATALVVAGGALSTQWATSSTPNQDGPVVADGDTAPTGHQVTVQTTLEGTRAHYFEGALIEVSINPTSGTNPPWKRTSDGQAVGTTTVWEDVPTGDWTLTASTRVCGGNCTNLEPPSDTCSADLHIAGPINVLVAYRWGQPCQIQGFTTQDKPVADAEQKPCPAIDSEGRRYVLTNRPDGAGPGVGQILGTGRATGCKPSKVTVYSVNEQLRHEAITVSEGQNVWLYTVPGD